MNQSVHQLLRLILEGFTWFLKTIEALWDWSWAQIISAFRLSWADLPGWKIVVGLIAIAVLVALLAAMLAARLTAFGRITARSDHGHDGSGCCCSSWWPGFLAWISRVVASVGSFLGQLRCRGRGLHRRLA